MSDGVKIDLIEANGPVAKRENAPAWQSKWRVPVIYVLEDGRRLESSESFKLKRDAVAFAATLPAPPTHPTTAQFNEAGEFWGTRTSFYIGPQR